jgi:hypothetical protein
MLPPHLGAIPGAMELLFLLVPLGIGVVCFKAAAAKGRSRWIWGLVGTVAPLIGLLFVAFLPRIPRDDAA